MGNLDLWASVEKTDPAHTKKFTRGGGFAGTATNATFLAKRATEAFGPMGSGWGMEVISEQYVEGTPYTNDQGAVIARETIHKLHARLWYLLDGKRGQIEQFGQTTFFGKNSKGFFTDEEHAKKSLTDAMSKCLSLLGFSADIHLGLYDDNKYVADLRREFAAENGQAGSAAPRSTPEPERPDPHEKERKQLRDCKSMAELTAAWGNLDAPARRALFDLKEQKKADFEAMLQA